MSFAHDMPFGATVQENGQVRFRLWAPGQSAMSLTLEDDRQTVPMQPAGDGWFEATMRAAAGQRYRYQLADGQRVPDPASRHQDKDVHDASVVVDPRSYRWRFPDWHGCPWHEAVLYELHVGTFSPAGTFDGVRERLDTLAQIGVTAIELMPIADFPGRWNWGYDGVLPYAPDARYGTPDQLKALIDAAHERGMMIFLDVVYNHFGPDGNYLHGYAPQFFTERRRTPWGAAIDYRQRPVRDFYIHNALYWLEEYRFDGLRFDAVHEIVDDSEPHILQEMARAIRSRIEPRRHVHLVLENEHNSARLLQRNADGTPRFYTAQWNDDFHHAAHVILTGEDAGYYADYIEKPIERLGRALAEGFIYQGETSRSSGRVRGERSKSLPPLAFVNFIQNHDQIGNRAFGERLTKLASSQDALKAFSAILLLAPSVPMLFMGEEYGAEEPFCFFADFQGNLADAVRNGRREEFARFPAFADPEARQRIPDPVAPSTHKQSALDWNKRAAEHHRDWLEHCRSLLAVRRTELRPRLAKIAGGHGAYEIAGPNLLTVRWVLGDGAKLQLVAQLSDQPSGSAITANGRPIWTSKLTGHHRSPLQNLPPWFIGWFIDDARTHH